MSASLGEPHETYKKPLFFSSATSSLPHSFLVPKNVGCMPHERFCVLLRSKTMCERLMLAESALVYFTTKSQTPGS
jgi:hypothetical protein